MKKIVSWAVALTLVFTFCSAALAGPGETNVAPGTVTINGPGETN